MYAKTACGPSGATSAGRAEWLFGCIFPSRPAGPVDRDIHRLPAAPSETFLLLSSSSSSSSTVGASTERENLWRADPTPYTVCR